MAKQSLAQGSACCSLVPHLRVAWGRVTYDRLECVCNSMRDCRGSQEMEQWSPQLWGSHRRFAIRLLNLSKDKQKLLVEGDEGADRGV
jgi:hypothetical protein